MLRALVLMTINVPNLTLALLELICWYILEILFKVKHVMWKLDVLILL